MTDVDTETVSETQEVVAFRVSDQDFCFEIMSVREIRGWTETTILPHSQAYVKGVVNLRGSVVPVIDLSERLGLGAITPGPRHVVIITVVDNHTVGFLADVVLDIVTVTQADMKPVPEIISEAARAFISGVIVVDERMIRKIELARVLAETGTEAA